MGKDSCDFIQVSAGIRLTGSGTTAAGSGAGEQWGTESRAAVRQEAEALEVGCRTRASFAPLSYTLVVDKTVSAESALKH